MPSTSPCSKTPFLFLSAFLFIYCSYAQQLQVQVLDQQQEAIPYTRLILKSTQDSLFTLNKVTDETGRYTFAQLSPGIYTISAYALGFEVSKTPINFTETKTLRLVMSPLSESLSEVNIVSEKPIVTRKADRIIYDLSNSIAAQGSNGLQTLAQAPGVNISGNQISLAGKGQMGVMLNNRLVHLSGENLIRFLRSLSSSQISKLEIITHPSAKYTAEGNAGLVNIITKTGSVQGLSGHIEGGLQQSLFIDPPHRGAKTYGYGNIAGGLYYNTEKLSAYTNISYRHGRQIEGHQVDILYPNKFWSMHKTGDFKGRFFNVMGGVDYALSERSTLGVGYQFGKTIYIGNDHVKTSIYNLTNVINSTISTYADYYPVAYDNGINLHFIQELGQQGAKLTVNADYFNYYRRDRSNFETAMYDRQDELIPNRAEQYYDTTLQNIKIYTLKTDVEIPTDFAQYSFGGKISFIDNYSNIYYFDQAQQPQALLIDLSDEYRYKENTQALYADVHKKWRQWDLRLGLRAEFTQTEGQSYLKHTKVTNDYLKLFPSFLATYKQDDHNTFSVAFDKRIHRPTFWNLNPYKSLMTAYSYLEGNPYLQPEYISNIEVKHHYKDWLTSSLFVTLVNNGFANITQPHRDSLLINITPLNVIKGRRYGLSETVDIRPLHWWQSTTQATVYYAIDHSEVAYIKSVEGTGVYLETNNNFSFNQAKTWGGFVNFWVQFPEIKNLGESETYYNLDIGVRAKLLDQKLNVALVASDLLNSSAPLYKTTVNDLHTTFINDQVYSSVRLSVSWQFGNTKAQQHPVQSGNKSEKQRAG